jgi:hypothetical protein
MIFKTENVQQKEIELLFNCAFLLIAIFLIGVIEIFYFGRNSGVSSQSKEQN